MNQPLARHASRVFSLVVGALLLLAFLTPATLPVRPSAAQTYTGEITKQWLDQKLVEWNPSQNVSLTFGATDMRASYWSIQASYNTPAVQQADLNMLYSSGAGCIRMDIGYAAWLQNNQTTINEITSLVHNIRSAGKCLIIADAASETYRNGGQLLWYQFKQAWAQRVSTLASLFQPDYYVVVKEPGWYTPMVRDSQVNPLFKDPNDWLKLTQTLTSDVLAASPTTKVGVSAAADAVGSDPTFYVPYLTGASGISGISFLGFDLYTTTGFDSTQNFLSQHGSGSKSVWIAEAWSGDGSFIYDSSRAQLDKEWVQVQYYFAMKIGASAVIPFYTDLFSSYGLDQTTPTDPSEIVSLFGQRTPVFCEYASIISGGAPCSSNTTTTTTSTTSTGTTSSSSTTTTPTTVTSTTTTSSSTTSTSTTTSTTGAAVVLNSVQSTSGTVTSSPYQITLSNFNVGTGNNRLLVVGISSNNQYASSVTFGGMPLSQATTSFYNNDAELWYLVNPSGTGDITVTFAGPTATVVGAYSFSGVNQADPIPTVSSSYNTAAGSPSVSVTTQYPNSLVLDLPSIYGGVTLGSPSCTQEWDFNVQDAITGASSSATAASPGQVTCGWIASNGGDFWDDVAIEIRAA